MRLTQPLGLQQALQPLNGNLNPVALIDVGLIALMFVILGSRFILAPGIGMDIGGKPELPESTGQQLPGVPVVKVMTIKDLSAILYQGRFYTLGDLEQIAQSQSAPVESGILLVRMNRNVAVDTLFRVSDWARDVGFDAVQIAGTAQRQRPFLDVPTQ